jgi:hypothetical protein
MARIRSVKPDFFRSRKIRSLPYEARWLFEAMWTESDDPNGVMPCTAAMLRGMFFDTDPKATERKVEGWIKMLEAKKLLILYEVDGQRYSKITGWHHQRINKPQEAKYPPPPPDTLFPLDSVNGSGTGSGSHSGTDSGNRSRTHSSRGLRKGLRKGEKQDQDLDSGLIDQEHELQSAPPDCSDPPVQPLKIEPGSIEERAVSVLVSHGKTHDGAVETVAAIGAEAVLQSLEAS